MKNRTEGLAIVMEGLMKQYSERVPDVERIIAGMLSTGIIKDRSEIENDHIAFRTIGVPLLGIQSLEKIFCHYGYEKKDYFRFEGKKLDAYWFAPPSPKFPRIFISELKVEELSQEAQSIILSYTNEVKADPLDTIDLDDPHAVAAFLHTPLWRLPKLSDYGRLLQESEYASWVIYNRYYLNHYTISVHQLKEGYNTLDQFNQFLESIGIQLNDAGGKTKVSGDGLLLQSSTVAQIITATFDNNESYDIAGSYVEFAERRVLPAFENMPKTSLQREHYRDGFETSNADKIFESTFTDQVLKKDRN
jgi:hypothetical protein